MWKSNNTFLIVLMLLGGCAVGVKHDYIENTLDLEVSTDNSFVVSTLDHRSYVLNNQKNENFVGLSRGGFGNPFDVITQSGNPLASDISTSIARSVREIGVDIEVIRLDPSQSVTDASKKLLSTGANRILLLTLKELKGDSMMNVRFIYDLDLNIFDQTGRLLVKKQVLGDETLGASDPFSPGGTDKIRARFRTLIENLFQDPEVSRVVNFTTLSKATGDPEELAGESAALEKTFGKDTTGEQVSVFAFYGEAEEEVNTKTYDKNLWAMALVNAEGDEQRRKAKYIELRANQLYSENVSSISKSNLNEQPVPVSAVSGTGISGTYVSDIRGGPNYSYPDRKIELTLKQSGKDIVGTDVNNRKRLIGTRKGDTIKFEYDGGTTTGVWKINSDGTRLDGTFTHSSWGFNGTWNLTKIE